MSMPSILVGKGSCPSFHEQVFAVLVTKSLEQISVLTNILFEDSLILLPLLCRGICAMNPHTSHCTKSISTTTRTCTA
jgi:hypothetical protein